MTANGTLRNFRDRGSTDIKGVPTHGSPRGRVLRVLIWSSVLLLLGVAFYSFFGRKEEVKVRPAAQITITTETAQKGNIGVFLEAIGTVTPVYTVSIFSQVTGVLLTDLAQLVRGMSRLPEPARYPHTVPYGTAFSGRTFPRHFVPGYDQLSPGQSHSHPA